MGDTHLLFYWKNQDMFTSGVVSCGESSVALDGLRTTEHEVGGARCYNLECGDACVQLFGWA